MAVKVKKNDTVSRQQDTTIQTEADTEEILSVPSEEEVAEIRPVEDSLTCTLPGIGTITLQEATAGHMVKIEKQVKRKGLEFASGFPEEVQAEARNTVSGMETAIFAVSILSGNDTDEFREALSSLKLSDFIKAVAAMNAAVGDGISMIM